MAEKSPNAFRTISEVSDVLDVPAHVLRFWESRFNQIKPIKRGGGRRYYRPTDVDLIRGIRTLLYTDGMTIKGAQKILREKGVRHVMELGSDAEISDIARDTAAVAEPPKAATDAAEAPAFAGAVNEMAEPSAPAPTPPRDETFGDAMPEAPQEDPATEVSPAPAAPAAPEDDFGASFAFEAVEDGYIDAPAPDGSVPDAPAPTSGAPVPVDPEADLSDPDPAPEPAPQSAPERQEKLRDVIGKLERLRDTMRSN